MALRATTQSTRWSLTFIWICGDQKNKRECVEFSSEDGSIFPLKLERKSKNLGANPSWALPSRDYPLSFWIFSLIFSWIFCYPPSLTSTYCYIPEKLENIKIPWGQFLWIFCHPPLLLHCQISLMRALVIWDRIRILISISEEWIGDIDIKICGVPIKSYSVYCVVTWEWEMEH